MPVDTNQTPQNVKVNTLYGWLPCSINGSDPKRGIFQVTTTLENLEPFPTWTHGGGAWVKTAAVAHTQIRFTLGSDDAEYRVEMLGEKFVAVPCDQPWPTTAQEIEIEGD